MPESSDEHSAPSDWLVGWDDVELEQLREFARLTFEQKVEWLEECQGVAEMFINARAHATRIGDGAPLGRAI